MRPNESFVGQPVRSLQSMLRVIAEQDGNLPSVVPDGIYGSDTIAAVTAFQRRYGLPATGVTDQNTWDAVVAAYEPALILIGPIQVIEGTLEPNQVIRSGQSHPDLFLAQGILAVLALTYGSIRAPGMTGVLDRATEEALSSFQELSGLPMTGQLDRLTWHRLALQYPLAAAILLEKAKGKEGYEF